MMRIFSWTYVLIGLLFLVGCKDGVKVQPGPNPPVILAPNISSPTIQIPYQSPHYSSGNSISIQGFCLDGYTVIIYGDYDEATPCEDSVYDFTVPKNSDGVYNFFISQIISGNQSNPIPFTWIRQSSVPPPSIVYPPSTPFHSALPSLTIQGFCQNGSTIRLQQDAVGTATCVNSQFSLTVMKFQDGEYNIDVVQTDQSGNASTSFVTWEKSALQVNPNNPQIIANEEQVFTATGGSLAYTYTFVENNSGATFDDGTNTYRAGTLAGVTDRLQVEDSLGVVRTINIEVVPASADHMRLPMGSGDNQMQLIGEDLGLPLRVQVVDRFGNGVPSYQILFQVSLGDASLLSSSIQTTDSNGFAQAYVRQGYVATQSTISVAPRTGTLPDVTGTGGNLLHMNTTSDSNNSGNLGLSFQLGSLPSVGVGGDFNGDGVYDLVVVNSGVPSLGVLLGGAKGVLSSMAEITGICSNPTDLASGDINGSGYLDLVLACGSDNEVWLFEGNGDGTFDSPEILSLSVDETLVVDVELVDLNGNGDLDLLAVSVASSVVAVRYGNGDGTYSAPLILNSGVSPTKVFAQDMTNNTHRDIVVLNSGEDKFGVFFNDGSNTFGVYDSFDSGLSPSDLKIADFNNDGWKDVVISSNIDNVISVYLNDQVGGFNLGIDTMVGDGPSSILVGDFSGDGTMDAVVSNLNDSSLSVLNGQGNGSFDIRPSIQTASSPIFLIAGDFLGNSLMDVLSLSIGDSKAEIFVNQASGGLGFNTTIPADPTSHRLVDLNGNGTKDLVVTSKSGNTLTVYYGDGYGHFSFDQTLMTGIGPMDVEAVDLNNDGILDLVVAQETVNSMRVFLAQGDGTFSGPVDYATGGQPAKVLSGDFNRDGHVDVVVANSGANTISFFPGQGDGSFGVRVDKAVGAQPVALASADINRNGNLDLLVVNKSEGSFSVLLGNGDGTFQDKVDFSSDSGANGVVVGYFDIDSYIDVAISNELAGSISVFRGNGDGSFQAPINYFSGVMPTSLVSGDINGDGRQDFIVGNQGNQSMTILFGSLFGDFSVSETTFFDLNPVFVGLGDTRSLSTLDILVFDEIGQRVRLIPGH